MTRLEKIVLEQTRKSKPGTVGQTVSTDAVNQKAKQLKAISFLLYYVFGKKQSPIDKPQVASVLPKISIYGDNSIYSRGEYFYVIGEDYKENEGTNKAVIYYPIYIIRQSESDIESLNKFMIGGTTIAPIIDMEQYELLLNNKNKNTNLTPSITVGDLERELVKDNPAINADFQRILNNFYIKFDLTDNPEYKNFVLANKQSDGSWDGNISSDETKTAIAYVKAGLTEPEYTGGNNINDLAKRLQSEIDAAVNESVNYFKGDNIQVSLLQLFEQALKEGFDKDKADAATKKPTDDPKTTTKTTTKTTPTTTNTKKKTSSTNFTQATFPSKYNGSGTITYNNGDKFTGSWENGLKSGKGKYTIAATKTTIDGYWEDGKKISGRKIIDIDVFYKESVASTQKILSKMVNYINNHKTFVGYKDTFGDDEEAALIDLVKPWFKTNIQPEVLKYYTKYIKPYMSHYEVPPDALIVDYDLNFVGTNNSVTNISNLKFKKIIQNYLVLKANSSDTALNHPIKSAAYYNYAGDKSLFTIPAMFFDNWFSAKVYYWSDEGGRAVYTVDTNF
jgi:hypothetical protein